MHETEVVSMNEAAKWFKNDLDYIIRNQTDNSISQISDIVVRNEVVTLVSSLVVIIHSLYSRIELLENAVYDLNDESTGLEELHDD